MRLAPEAIIASRSKPSAIPAAGGIPWARAARKDSSIGQKALPLLGGIGQLNEGVGQLDAADIKLEAQSHPRIGGVALSQRCLGRRPVGEEGRPGTAKVRFHPFEQKAEEQVFPGFARAQPRPCRLGERFGITRRGEQIRAHIAGKSFREGQALGWLVDASSHAAAAHFGRQRGGEQGVGFGDQILHRRAGPVPLEQGELGGVQVTALAVAPNTRQLENWPCPADEQLFHGELGAGVQPQRRLAAVRGTAGGGKSGEVHFLAGGGNGVGSLHFEIAAGVEERAHGGGQPRPAAQERQACGKAVGVPERLRHGGGQTTAEAMDKGSPPARTWRRLDALAAAGLLHPSPALEAVAERYAVAVPPAMQALIRHADDPIGRQFLPHPDELTWAVEERADPIGDAAFSPVKGLVHRYPDRALLQPLLACPVYCRFCFRREKVGHGQAMLTEDEIAAALAWLSAHGEIREVILSGGDCLLLSPRRLGALLARLSAIGHVLLLRIHSRLPLADPPRVTPALVAALAAVEKPLWLVVHANHAAEFTAAGVAALEALRRAGLPLLGQSVLLRGVNDSVDALADLFLAMLQARVKPYYLHQLDAAPGTARFRVPIAEGQRLLRALRGRISGHALPSYVFDIPGGHGKVPIGPAYVDGQTVRDPWGESHPLG